MVQVIFDSLCIDPPPPGKILRGGGSVHRLNFDYCILLYSQICPSNVSKTKIDPESKI